MLHGKPPALHRALGPEDGELQTALCHSAGITVQLTALTAGLAIHDKGNVAPPSVVEFFGCLAKGTGFIGKHAVYIGLRQYRIGKQNRNIGDISGDAAAVHRHGKY